MRVYIFTDLEGATGVMEFDYGEHERRMRDREFLIQDINAAVSGAYAAGAEEVFVCDGHGNGAVLVDELDTRATFIDRSKSHHYLTGLDSSFTHLLLIGFHSMAGSEGLLNHTYSLRVHKIVVNDVELGEIGLSFLCANQFGVKPVFISGDKNAVEEAGLYASGITGVAVKRLIKGKNVECISASLTSQLIRNGVCKALSSNKLPILSLPQSPFQMDVIYKKPWIALPRYIIRNRFPEVRLNNLSTIVFQGSNFIEIMDKFIGTYKKNQFAY